MSWNNGEKDMYVTKRNGTKEVISFDKILQRLKKLGRDSHPAAELLPANLPLPPVASPPPSAVQTPTTPTQYSINFTTLTMKVIEQLFDGISTTKIDELSAEQCASMSSIHPDYNALAGRIIISNHHKATLPSFSKTMKKLYNNVDVHGDPSPLISNDLYKIVCQHGKVLDAICDYQRDFDIDYFGFKTLLKSYLMKVANAVVERPQHMWLRVALGIHGSDIEKAKETYYYMSTKCFTHATPTLFNAGTPKPQLSSCFLLAMESDSIDGIFNTLKDCALISKYAGGIGLHIHNIRAAGSKIHGTNGTSNGIVPMLRVFNNTAKYVDQCLDPETFVYTKRGAIPIKNIVIGDEIVADDGNYYEIGKVLDNQYRGNMYKFDIDHSSYPLHVTDMHPLWTIKNDKNHPSDIYTMMKLLNRNLITSDFVEAKYIDKNDYIGFPIPLYEKDLIQYTEDDCRFYGIVLGAVEINDENNTTCITLNKETQSDTIQFVESYLTRLNMLINYSIMDADNMVKLTWRRNNMFKFTYEMVYDNKHEKHVIPNMLHLPKHKVLQIVKGIIESTATVFSCRDNVTDEFMLGISRDGGIGVSQNMIESIRYMLLRCGILTNGLHIPKVETICKLFPDMVIDLTAFDTFFQYENCLFTKVNNVSLTKQYVGRVIDIEVNNDNHHNFLTQNGLVHNGGGKRNGSIAVYLEPWHADIENFLQMKKNTGDEELKARDLFYALWIPDLFMKRVKEGGKWTLMCPDECRGLADVFGDAFETLYTKYEAENKGKKTVNARDLWFQILDAQMETGTPYLLYKDAANKKSNQQNLGTIKSSNLCCEVMEYSDDTETAVCNLGSIALPSCVDLTGDEPRYDFEKLHKITRIVTYNLNKVIDINYYPIEKARRSNMRHRPIGIGVQGLADTFLMMNYPFVSDQAKLLNKQIFETMYHAALTESCAIAKVEGPYETFQGSPASKGLLQFDLWDRELKVPYDSPSSGPMREQAWTNAGDSSAIGRTGRFAERSGASGREGLAYASGDLRKAAKLLDANTYNWKALKEEIKTHGLRNSLLLAPMPTASTSQILGYNECIEPITSNIYSRRTLAGEFIMANKYLMNDLIRLGLWNEKVKNYIIANHGSIQGIQYIPLEIREKYKTVWELPMKALIDMAADRGVYICQSQSLNLWIEDPTYNSLTSMHFYSWSKGLKTGIYYLRRRAKYQAQQFTIEPEKVQHNGMVEEDEICEMCSS